VTTTRWTLTLAGLLGEPWPPLPALPGRVHRCRDDPDEGDAFEPPTVLELQERLGLSRQGAWLRLQAYRKRPDAKKLLAPVQRRALLDADNTID